MAEKIVTLTSKQHEQILENIVKDFECANNSEHKKLSREHVAMIFNEKCLAGLIPESFNIEKWGELERKEFAAIMLKISNAFADVRLLNEIIFEGANAMCSSPSVLGLLKTMEHSLNEHKQACVTLYHMTKNTLDK